MRFKKNVGIEQGRLGTCPYGRLFHVVPIYRWFGRLQISPTYGVSVGVAWYIVAPFYELTFPDRSSTFR